MKHFKLRWLMLAIASFPMMAFAQVSNENEDGVNRIEDRAQGAFRQNELIVKFKDGSSVRKMAKGRFKTSAVSAVDRVFAELGVEEVEMLMPFTGTLNANAPRKVRAYSGKDVEVMDMSRLYTVRLDASSRVNVHEAIEKLQALDDVEFAEPNYLVYTMATGDGDLYKKDPLYNNNGHWGITAINIYNLWNTPKITAKRPVVAILDTGVDITHPDLAANIWTNKREEDGAENRDDDGNGYKDDVHGWDFVNQTGRIRDNNGHGTHCAGIAAAVGGNGIGIAGANPDAWIMPVTVMQSDGTGDVATVIKGIDYAAANGADVISMSFGSYSNSTAEEQALAHAYTTAILVAAAGNDGYCMNHVEKGQRAPMPMFPAAYNFVLGVQASRSGGGLAGFSNYDDDGPFYSSYGEDQLYNYELTAPGVTIISTFPGGQYKTLNGTSMACPLVAGAISRLMQCKEITSKEEFFGDLINSKTAAGDLDIYKAYLKSDADRKPTLNLVTYNFDDAAGDGDGRPDAGETIDIYPVIRNSWGTAKNIRVSIELAETEDPEIVQIITGTADFGNDLSSYAKGTSVNPLRIKINEDCADGRHIRLVVKATCDNISKQLEQEINLKAENGVEIGGVIADDMTLHEGVNYIVTSLLGVPQGVTLTIEPGAVIKFKDGAGFKCEGNLNAVGTPGKMITFTMADNATYIKYFNPEGSTIQYAYIKNLHISGGDSYFGKGDYKDCVFDNSYGLYSGAPICVFQQFSHVERSNILNTKGYLTQGTAGYGYSKFTHCNVIENNYLPDIRDGSTCNMFNNLYKDQYFNAKYDLQNSVGVYRSSQPGYLGSAKQEILDRTIIDMDHPIYPTGFGSVDVDYLAKCPVAEAHGIVWKVVVNGKDAQDEFDELAPLGVGKHKFEVYFNRPMNKAVAPTISMGVSSPYTSVIIAEEGEDSGWNDEGTIYTAYLTITGKSNYDGLNRIRVYGAEDDEFFEIPEEKIRFNVNVQKAGAMATGLMATEGLGKVTLTWETAAEDFADLMGYNVYRYETKPESAIQINSSLIDPDNRELVDYDVIPGHTYYYMVKEMGTDLQQHDISNVVAATPLTAEKGDANGSLSVDVADVMTDVYYLTGQDPQPFIFDAADVNSDARVNVLDIIGTVNIIKDKASAMSYDEDEQVAFYSVVDGKLCIESPCAISGFQVVLDGKRETDHIDVAENMHGFEIVNSWLNDNSFLFLGYSLSGNVLAPGSHALIDVDGARVKDIVLSNVQGHNVVALDKNNEETKIAGPSAEGYEGCTYLITDLSGCIVRPSAMQHGVYIVNIMKDGKMLNSYKYLK